MSDLFGEDFELPAAVNQKTKQKKSHVKYGNLNPFQKLEQLQSTEILIDNNSEQLENELFQSLPVVTTKNKTKKKAVEKQAPSLDNFGIVTITSQFDPSKKAKELIDKINWATSQRRTEFVGEIINLARHSSVAVRRKAAESLAIIGDKETINAIQEWEKMESDRTTLLTLTATIDKLERTEKFGQNKNILTVSEALKIVKTLLGKDIYQVEGEICEPKFYETMAYFGLKENQDNRLDCSSYLGIIKRLDFVLNEGLSVRITGRFKLSKFAKLCVEIVNIELTGEGAILQNLKKLEERLTLEGLFDESRKRAIAKFPTNILLIASGNSAAMGDFLKVLGHRRTGMTIYHQNIKSQGVGAELEIVETLAQVNQIIDRYSIDTVVMTRGGGSSDDLFVFNSEKIVRSLHGLKKPVIVAIGHERDVSLTEKAADLRASTPSNAAELVSQSNWQIENFLEQSESFCQNFYAEKASKYLNFAEQICQLNLKTIQNQIQINLDICQKTDNLIFELLGSIRQTLDQNQLYYNQILSQINQQKQQTRYLYQNILSQVQSNWHKTQSQVTLLDTQLEIENPAKILAKGYAIIKQNDRIVTQASQINKSKKLSIQMQDGEVIFGK